MKHPAREVPPAAPRRSPPRAVFLIRTAISESIPSSVNGWSASTARLVGIAHDRRNASAQPVGDDPVDLDGIQIAKRIRTRPVAAALECVQFLEHRLRSSRVAGSRGMRPLRDQDAAVRRPTWRGCRPAATPGPRCPSAGLMGSRTPSVNERAIPTSDHWPQLIAVAGRPDALRHDDQGVEPRIRARVRRLPRASPAGKPPRKSQPTSRALGWRWLRAAAMRPAAFGAQTRSRLSLLRRGHQTVVDHGRRMHDSTQRQSGLFGGRHQSFGHSGRGDIPLYDNDLGAAFAARQGPLPLLVRGIAATVEHDAAGTAVDQPASDDHAETAETAGDDV